jgi:hypothetical protein
MHVTHGRRLFKISGNAQVCVTNPSGRKYEKIKNRGDENESAPRTREKKGVELQCVHSLLPLLNSNCLLNQTKLTTYHTTGFTAFQKYKGQKRYGKP